jgi:hypothetical protein
MFGVCYSRLCTAGEIWMDGTFKSAPNLFHQLYTMHAKCHGEFIPVLLAFLPSKDEATYRRLLTLISQSALAANLIFAQAGTVIHYDYEMAVIRVVQTELHLNPTGCLFHYCQCIYREIQRTGLAVSLFCSFD